MGCDSAADFAFVPPDRTSGQNVVKCNLKANQGELYLLDKALIFIARAPLLVDFANIQTVSFSRCVSRSSQ